MKIFGFMFGVLLLAVGGYVVIGEHLAGVSASAEINAQLTTIRAPIRGTLTLHISGIGGRVWPNQIIATIEDERVDTARLSDLQQAEASLVAELNRVASQTASLRSAREALLSHADNYRQGRIRQLEARIAEAQAQKAASLARLGEQDAALIRANDLMDRGVQTAANLERAKAGRDVAAEELKAAEQRIAYLTIEREAAKNDTFLGDSYNDAPYSMQRTREIALRLAELAAERESLERKLKQARLQVSAELQRVYRQRSAELHSPVNGLIWDFRASTGEVVGQGGDLLRLVDCDTVIITASVSERLYNKLKLGDRAQFRLLDTDKVFDAMVTRLAGLGASGIYQNLAIPPSRERLERYDVTLNAHNLKGDPDAGCSVGRTGRVVFSSSPLERIHHLIAGVGLR